MSLSSQRQRINFMKPSREGSRAGTKTLYAFIALLAGINLGVFVQTYESAFEYSSHESKLAPPAQKVVTAKKIEVLPVLVAKISKNQFSDLLQELRARKISGLEVSKEDIDSNGIRVTLKSDAFFESGSAKLVKSSRSTFGVIEALLRRANPSTVVEIEGHTDNSPVLRQRKIYPSNWELSAARAASLIPLLERAGIKKDKLSVIGYGDSRPLTANRFLANSKNRRIVLHIFARGEPQKSL